MRKFVQWLENKQDLEVDDQGGIVPQDLHKARPADLITLPRDVQQEGGTNCFNCKYIEKHGKIGWCKYEKVHQWVNERNCCSFWNHDKVKRPFKIME